MQNKLVQVSARTSLIYWAIAALWILLSDHVLTAIISDRNTIDSLQTYKGWLFVTVTALLLYALLRRQLRRWEQEAAERRKAEQSLQTSQHQLTAILNSALDAIITVDEQQRIVLFNHAAEATYRCASADALGQSLDRFISTGLPLEAAAGMKIIRGRRANGEEFPLEASISQVEVAGFKFLTVIHRDITERIKADAEREALQEKLAKFAATTPGALHSFRLSPDNVLSMPYASAAIEDIYGLRPEDVAQDATAIFRLIHPEDLRHVNETIQESARTMSLWWDVFRVQHPQKGETWVEGISSPTLEPDGSLLWHGFLMDVTARKKVEQSLEENKQLNHAILNSLTTNIAVLDQKGTIIALNEAWSRFAAASAAETPGIAVGANYFDVFGLAITGPEGQSHANAIEAGLRDILEGRSASFSYEYPYSSPEGICWFLLNAAPLLRKSGGVVVAHNDITERKQIEEEIRQFNATLEQRVMERTKELRASEERMQLVGNHGTDGFWDWNMLTDEEYLSPSFKALFGYEDDEIPNHLTGWQRIIFPEDLERANQAFVEHTTEGKPYDLQVRYRHKNGSTVWVICRGVAIKDDSGKFVRMVGTHVDITAQKEAEEALQKLNDELEQRIAERTKALSESEARFRQLAESLPQMVWTCDAEGRNDYSSPHWVTYTGVVADEKTDEGYLPQIHPDDRDRVLQAWHNAIATGSEFTFEFRIRRHDGVYRWFDTRAVPLRDETGRVVKWFGTNTDIQEQREMREALRASEEHLRLATEAAQIGTWERDLKTNRIIWSAREEQLMGYESGTFPNTYEAFFALVHPEDQLILTAAQQIARETGVYKTELRFRLPDGRERWGLLRGQMIYNTAGQPERIVGIDMDITERKRDEAALSQSYEQVLTMIEQAPAGIAMLDRNICYLAASLRWKQDFDKEDEVFTGRSHYEVFQDVPDRWKEIHQRALAGETLKNDEDLWIHSDGSRMWLRWVVQPWRDAYGKIGGILMAAENITPRKQAEEKLRESEQRLQAVVENLAEGLIIMDIDGQISRWNRAALEMHGLHDIHEALLRLPEMEGFFDLFNLDGTQLKSEERPNARIRRGECLRNHEVRIQRRGTDWQRIFSYNGNIMLGHSGKPLAVLTITDITERKQAEERLRQSEAHFRALFEAGGVGSVECEAESGRFLRVNQKMCQIVGYSAEELQELTFTEITHPEDRASTLVKYQQFITRAAPEYEVEKRYIRKDGAVVWASVTSTILFDKEDRPWHTVAVVQDVTERKQAEAELRESEERFRTLFEQSAVGQLMIDYDDLTVVACNQLTAQMLGYTREELIGLPIADIEARHSLEEIHQLSQAAAKGEKIERESLFRTKTGELRNVWVIGTNIRLKGKHYAHASILDITDRKRAEEELERERMRLEKIAFSSPSVIYSFRLSPEGQYSFPYVSAAFFDLYGFRQKDVQQDANLALSRIHPDDFQGLTQSSLASAREMSRWQYTWRINHPYKGEIWVEGYAAPLREADGGIVWHGILNDVTHQKHIEQERRNDEERLKLALAAARMGVWEWDIQSNAVFWSPECYEMLGSDGFDETMDGFTNLVHAEDRERIMHAVQQAITEKVVFSAEFRVTRTDGKQLWLLNLGRAQYNAQGVPTRMIGIAQDITERKRAEAELEKSLEQVRSLALHVQNVREEERKRIAREIHDEWGQALAGLKFDLFWLENHLVADDPAALRLCQEKAHTMTELIGSTIEVGRKIATELRPRILDDLGLVIALRWQAQEFQTRTGIHCNFVALPEDLTVSAEQATALFRIFQETLTNVARHAQATTINAYLKKQDDCLRLKVRDNGRGITVQEMSRPGSLGLVGMRERVLPFGGKIRIRGKAGKGTIVIVSLPLQKETREESL